MKTAYRALLLAVVGVAIFSGEPTQAADLTAGLADAEQRVSTTEEELSQRQQQLKVAAARYRAAAAETAPLTRSLDQKRADAERLRNALETQQLEASTRISQLENEREKEAKDQDQEVRTGIGFGIAALIAGLIAIAWGWFRATAPVAALTELELGQAIGVCIGGGLLLVIVGAVLGSSEGVMGAIGSLLFCLGIILPTAFLLARHSAEVQRGRSKSLLRRERLPSWVSISTAGLMLVIFLASTGSAIFADGASSQSISAQLREEAQATSEGDGAEELKAADEAIAAARQQASAPLARQAAAREVLAEARQSLAGAKQALARAESSQHSFARRLAALEARERRETERAEARAVREEEEQIEEEEAELAAQCHPSYSPCLDPSAPDYDCEGGSGDGPLYTGTVEVIGYDEYELDDDGDGIGCDP